MPQYFFTKAITIDNVDGLTEEQIIKRAIEAHNEETEMEELMVNAGHVDEVVIDDDEIIVSK